jgi:cysteine-rich repeat protein
MKVLVIVLALLFPVTVQAATICMVIPPDKEADAQGCKDDFQSRAGRTLTNSQMLSRAVLEFCRKERRLETSKTLNADIDAAVAAMDQGWCECGDGDLCYLEVCDDSNTADGDGCNAECTSDETCGNGFVDIPVGEVCDDGNSVPGDGCENDCTETP